MATVPLIKLPVLIFIVIIGGLTAVFSPTEAGYKQVLRLSVVLLKET